MIITSIEKILTKYCTINVALALVPKLGQSVS